MKQLYSVASDRTEAILESSVAGGIHAIRHCSALADQAHSEPHGGMASTASAADEVGCPCVCRAVVQPPRQHRSFLKSAEMQCPSALESFQRSIEARNIFARCIIL